MFDGMRNLWELWGIWSSLKGGTMNAEQIQMLASILIPIVGPLITRYLKILAPKLPKLAIVILQPILGAIMAALVGVDPTAGAGLGVAGIGVREVVDQSIKTAKRMMPSENA